MWIQQNLLLISLLIQPSHGFFLLSFFFDFWCSIIYLPFVCNDDSGFSVFNDKAELIAALNDFSLDDTDGIFGEYGPIQEWDVSRVQDFAALFKDKRDFDVDLSSWDTSSATTMAQMFMGATQFNQDLSE